MTLKQQPSVLITGAGRGFGRDLTDVFNENGWEVLALVRTPESAAAIKSAAGRDLEIIVGDLTEAGTMTGIADVLEKRNRPLDLLINNAGNSGRTHIMDDVPPEEIEGLFKVHCLGALQCAQTALPWLRKAQSPLIVNVTSRLGSLTNVSNGAFSHLRASYAYRIAKAAQNMLTACMIQDPSMKDIRTVAMHPGKLTTTRNASIDADVTSREAAEKMFTLASGRADIPGNYFDLTTSETFPW